jgi:hypothetical protein
LRASLLALEGASCLAVGRVDELRVVVDADGAARLADAAEDRVGEVARMVAHGPRARVRSDHGRARGLDRVERRAVRHVAHIHHHAERVHAGDERSPRLGEAPSRMGARRGVAEGVVVRPREGDVPDAAARELREALEQDVWFVFAEAVRAFEAHQEGHAARACGRAHLGSRRGERDLVGVRCNEGADGRDERARTLPRGLSPKAARIDPEAHEDGGEAAFAHARQIEMTVLEPCGQIGVLVEEALCRVRVCVDRDEHLVARLR